MPNSPIDAQGAAPVEGGEVQKRANAHDGPLAPVAHRATVGTGPLFFFIKPAEHGDERWDEVHFVDPETGSESHHCVSAPGNLALRHRVGRSKLLAYSYSNGTRNVVDGYFLFDFEQGQATHLFADARYGATLLDVDKSTLFFLEHQNSRAHPYALQARGENEALSVRTLRNRLYRMDTEGPIRKSLLFNGDLVDVFAADREHYWAVAEDQERLSLWRVSKDGKLKTEVLGNVKKIVSKTIEHLLVLTETSELCQVSSNGKTKKKLLRLDPAWKHRFASCAFSPSKRFIAFGVVLEGQDLGTRNLVVFELETQKLICELNDIRVGVTPNDKSRDALRFIWLDDKRIRFSESRFEGLEALQEKKQFGDRAKDGVFQWVDVNVTESKRVAERTYTTIWGHGGNWPSHFIPYPDRGDTTKAAESTADGKETRFFEIRDGGLYFRGEQEPIVDYTNERGVSFNAEMNVSPQGKWAVFVSPDEKNTMYLVNGGSRRKSIITRAWARSVEWFPRTQ